jgi:hypothetical protein
MAKRVRSLRQRVWQWSVKVEIKASCSVIEGGRGCWALPLENSPKLKALKRIR